jgi:hypothetical protein
LKNAKRIGESGEPCANAGLAQGSPLSPILFAFFNCDLVDQPVDFHGGASMLAWRPLMKLAIHFRATDGIPLDWRRTSRLVLWYRQKVVSLVAFDLKGAFNGVNKTSLDVRLQSKGLMKLAIHFRATDGIPLDWRRTSRLVLFTPLKAPLT